MIVEVCAGSLTDCLIAQKYGANRIELNVGLHLGGLTPSLALLTMTKREVDIPIICMVRPRAAGFCYTPIDVEVMFEDAKILLENGADGLAFGFLNDDRTINRELMKKMIDLCHSYNREAVCHRALDCARDLDEAITVLIELGCDRILTSGGEANVSKGIEKLAYLQKKYGDKIELLMGSGVSIDNIELLMTKTGITQCHASFKSWFVDDTTSSPSVSYQYVDGNYYDGTDQYKLTAFLEKLQEVEK